MIEPPLGARMHSAGIVLKGELPELRWLDLMLAVCAAIGMEPVGEPKVWTYPVDGKGGTGQTIVLPITESFIALDTWRDHCGAYLFVCSCRSFHSKDIDAAAIRFGLTVDLSGCRRFYRELDLK